MNTETAKAFIRAQKEFAPALKNSVNPHFKNKYADLSACIDAVIDALHANGFALMQRTVGDNANTVVIETVFLHESGDVLSGGTMALPVPKNDPQGYGSALTYARRYSLMATAGIAGEDDDGNGASFDAPPPPPAPAPKQRIAETAARAAAAAPASPAPSNGNGPVFLFGKLKGLPLSSASLHDLEWYRGVVLKGIADPSKAKYKASSERHLQQVDAAITALDASHDTADADEYPPPHSDDDVPF